MIKKFYFPLTISVRARGDYGWSDDCLVKMQSDIQKICE